MTDTAFAAPARRAALIFVFFTVLIDVLAFGLIIPVLPNLIMHVGGFDFGRKDSGLWY